LKAAVARKYAFTFDNTHLIAADFAENCQEKVETFLRIKQQIEARYAGVAVGFRLVIGIVSVAIPTGLNRTSVLYSWAESLRIPDWINVTYADDFCSCPNLRNVITGLHRENDGLPNFRKLE
jgi:hypothetical protein